MSGLERWVERADRALRNVSPESAERARRSAKRRARRLLHLLKVGAWMLGAAVVIPVAMITGGFFLGPRGYEGVVMTPLAVLAAWSLILYLGLRPRVTPRKIRRAELTALPEQLEDWLERQRPSLPAAAQTPLDSLSARMEALTAQVHELDAESQAGRRLRRLLVEELAELVRGYQKLPAGLRNQPLHGGPSPTERLVEGLSTVDGELGRLQERLAEDDLRNLATHQRYLELKYEDDDGQQKP